MKLKWHMNGKKMAHINQFGNVSCQIQGLLHRTVISKEIAVLFY